MPLFSQEVPRGSLTVGIWPFSVCVAPSYPARQVEAKGPQGPVNYAPRKAYFMDKPKMDGTTTSAAAFQGWRLAENRPSLGAL